MQKSPPAGKFVWLGLVGLLLMGLLAGLGLALRPSTPAPFMTLRQPFSRPLPLRDRLATLIPGASKSAWMWRLENTVFGQRKPITICAEIISLSPSAGPGLVSSLALGPPIYSEPKGLQVWLLQKGDIQTARQQLKQTPGVDFLNRPRIGTADGVEASVFVGQSMPLNGVKNDVGLKLDCFPRVRDHSTDLFAVIQLSEALTNPTDGTVQLPPAQSVSIQTNLDLAARVQIPKGSGVLLLTRSSDDQNHKTFGILIDPP
jgi:hypothetical protein